jgi:hypothetical protein
MFDGLIHTEANYAQFAQIARRVKEMLGNEIKISLIASQDKPVEKMDWDGTLLLDLEHVLHARYGAGSPSLYFVRPDGYIGFCCQPARLEPLLQYLERVFVLQLPISPEPSAIRS